MRPWPREILRCPACQGELTDLPRHLACEACGLAYPVEDGAPGLVEHLAVPLESVR